MGEIKFNIPINFNSTLMENKKKEKLLKLKTEQKIYSEFWEEKKTIPKCGFQFIEQYCNKYLIFIIKYLKKYFLTFLAQLIYLFF